MLHTLWHFGFKGEEMEAFSESNHSSTCSPIADLALARG
jgi:hypothetical protein